MEPRRYVVAAIILKRRNWRDMDRFVTVFTRKFGKLSLLAKGSRKITSSRNAHIEPLRKSTLSVYKSHAGDMVTEAVTVQDYTGQSDLIRITKAYYLCELVDTLTAVGQAHEEVYDALVQALENVSTVDIDEYTHRFLIALGYLEEGKKLTHDRLIAYVESITERKLKTPKILSKIAG